MSEYYVERQIWQRWPKVLVMCKKTGNGVERRRYVPEGGTRDEWNERTREVMRKYSEAADKLNARMLEESRMPNLQAEIDGLQWAVEERDTLIRDLLECRTMLSCLDCSQYGKCDGYDGFKQRMESLGIEAGS